MSDTPVRLCVSNKKAYVWNVDDIATLRSKHNICGLLTGTLPHLSQQNMFLGVPLVLMPEEVVLLVEKEFAVLVDDPNAHPEPSISQMESWDSERKVSKKQQIAAFVAREAKEGANSHRAMSEEAIRKRQLREEKRALKLATAQASDDTSLFEPPPPVATASSTPRSGTPVPGSQQEAVYTVLVPASSSTLEWYSPESATYTTIADAKAASIWDYPSTLHERAKCGVFKQLWEDGYFMGVGIKFGGDYLVYPGDPLRYHSHFSASVIDSPVASLRPMEIVAHGRLGTATKKSHLLCGWDDEKQVVSCISIEWAAFG